MSYKYAKVRKDQYAPEVLVMFSDKRDREEQRLRFIYEFPSGIFKVVDYEEARRGFCMEAKKIPCELCADKTYPALFSRDVIKRYKQGGGI